MARLARFAVAGIPHHVTQRGNGRQQVFCGDEDDAADRDLLAVHCAVHGVAVWTWVLMPNHVHLILVPRHSDALRAALSRVNRAYAGRIHARAADRAFLATPLRLRGDGRGACDGGTALCCA